MIKGFISYLSRKPAVFNFLRKIIEFDFISIKRIIRREFRSFKNQKNHKILLDIPCGTGEFTNIFDPSIYIGADISDIYLSYARKKYPHEFKLADATNTNFGKNSFRFILMIGLLHHLTPEERIMVFKEMNRIIQKDGRYLLIEDEPIRSGWNFIGRILQRLDMGRNIQSPEDYLKELEIYFTIKKRQSIGSGFWQYSAMVLEPKGKED